MRKKDPENEKLQKESILTAAWKLFYEKGYDKTSLNEILNEIGASKGRFYYYFNSKAELLNSLYLLFDEKYLGVYKSMDPGMSGDDKMICLQREIFRFLEEEVGYELLKDLYLTQLEGKTEIDFWGSSRIYRDIMREIIRQAVAENTVRSDVPVDTIIDAVIVVERGQFLDWCLQKGGYKLSDMGLRRMSVYLGGFGKRYEGFVQELPPEIKHNK